MVYLVGSGHWRENREGEVHMMRRDSEVEVKFSQ